MRYLEKPEIVRIIFRHQYVGKLLEKGLKCGDDLNNFLPY